LSILVGMYDSRDVIVTEIQMWLARQLLNVKNYDYDEHVSFFLSIRLLSLSLNCSIE
jgi:hypothetical protein